MLYEEIPYHTAVLVREYQGKNNTGKDRGRYHCSPGNAESDIIGEKGTMIKKIGTEARKDIEAFLQQKVFLELFVKVKPKWRENELQLKEYGY